MRQPEMVWIDFDGPIANLLPTWLSRYNKRYADNVREEDIKGWAMHPYCSHATPAQLYGILNEHDLYDEVQPTEGALEALESLTDANIPWAIATSCTSLEMVVGKLRWLKWYRVNGKSSSSVDEWPKWLVPIHDKSLLLGKALIDDGVHNLEHFGGTRILWDAPYNREATQYDRVTNWIGARKEIDNLYRKAFFFAGGNLGVF